MSEAIQGAIVGGAIALLGSLLTLRFQEKQHNRDRLLQHLLRRRQQKGELHARLLAAFKESVVSGRWGDDAWTDLTAFGSPTVVAAVHEMVRHADETPDEKRTRMWAMAQLMKDGLADLDRQIDEAAGVDGHPLRR